MKIGAREKEPIIRDVFSELLGRAKRGTLALADQAIRRLRAAADGAILGAAARAQQKRDRIVQPLEVRHQIPQAVVLEHRSQQIAVRRHVDVIEVLRARTSAD